MHPLSIYIANCVPVGDFGLATSSLAAIEPISGNLNVTSPDADMTLGLLQRS